MELGRRLGRAGAALLLAVTAVAADAAGPGGSAQASVYCPRSQGCMELWDSLYPGESRWSANRDYRLVMTYQGDLELWHHNTTLVWASGTAYAGAEQGSQNYAIMQDDANLVIYDEFGTALWESGTWVPDSLPFLKVQDDGKLEIYESNYGTPVAHQCGSARPFCYG